MPLAASQSFTAVAASSDAGAQQIVPAAMARAAPRQRTMLGDAGLLAQPGQRVVFAEDGDDRPVLAGLAHHCGRDAGEVLRDAEPVALQHGLMLGGRADFLEVELRHAPDAVAEGLELFPLVVHQLPDLLHVPHAALRSLIGHDPGAGGRRREAAAMGG